MENKWSKLYLALGKVAFDEEQINTTWRCSELDDQTSRVEFDHASIDQDAAIYLRKLLPCLNGIAPIAVEASFYFCLIYFPIAQRRKTIARKMAIVCCMQYRSSSMDMKF